MLKRQPARLAQLDVGASAWCSFRRQRSCASRGATGRRDRHRVPTWRVSPRSRPPVAMRSLRSEEHSSQYRPVSARHKRDWCRSLRVTASGTNARRGRRSPVRTASAPPSGKASAASDALPASSPRKASFAFASAAALNERLRHRRKRFDEKHSRNNPHWQRTRLMRPRRSLVLSKAARRRADRCRRRRPSPRDRDDQRQHLPRIGTPKPSVPTQAKTSISGSRNTRRATSTESRKCRALHGRGDQAFHQLAHACMSTSTNRRRRGRHQRFMPIRPWHQEVDIAAADLVDRLVTVVCSALPALARSARSSHLFARDDALGPARHRRRETAPGPAPHRVRCVQSAAARGTRRARAIPPSVRGAAWLRAVRRRHRTPV